MTLSLSNLLSVKTKNPKKRLGRGNASGEGGYCGRGLKGQRSRSGGRKGLKIKGLRILSRRLPKLGGFNKHKKIKDKK